MATVLRPIYTPGNLTGVAYALRYSWAAWTSSGSLPAPMPQAAWHELEMGWESDGLRVLENRWRDNAVQITFSTTPQVSPILLATRAKGRLQHALRKAGTPVPFSRKLSLRSIGDNDCDQIAEYIRSQAAREGFADARFTRFLEGLVVDDPAVDLALPSETESGRYWCNLHLALVVHGRFRFGSHEDLEKLRDGCLRIADKKGHRISTLSVMPDHLHVALRGNLDQSPEEIAMGFLNNLAFQMGQNAVWQFGYYAGTFGEYRMDGVRGRE